jgi:CSLREA domain-containing protein
MTTDRRQRALSAAIEAMESRLLLSNSIVVNSLADTATGDSNTTGPTVSLREAVNYENANGGGTISFAASLTTSAPVTITLATSGDGTAGPSDLGIDSNITLVGANGSNGITLSNSGDQRLFYIHRRHQ